MPKSQKELKKISNKKMLTGKADLKSIKKNAKSIVSRMESIRELAYLRSERRGFDGGDAVQDWLAAEAEVDSQLSA